MDRPPLQRLVAQPANCGTQKQRDLLQHPVKLGFPSEFDGVSAGFEQAQLFSGLNAANSSCTVEQNLGSGRESILGLLGCWVVMFGCVPQVEIL